MAAHSSHRSSGTAAVVAVLLLGLGLATAWWALAPSILGVSQAAPIQGERPEVVAAVPAPAALAEGVRLSNSIQVTPPRDPFLPLVNANTGSGSGTLTGGSGSTATVRTSFTLGTVKDVSGVLRADVTIDGVDYSVGVGDEFAGPFMVVSLTEAEMDTAGNVTNEASGVFKYGDNTFTASAGQAILK